MTHSEQILQNDKYLQEYEKAKCALTLSELRLNQGEAGIRNISNFVKASQGLAEVLISYNKSQALLKLYLWTRNSIAKQYRRCGAGPGLKIACQADIHFIDKKITTLCDEVDYGNVTPILPRIEGEEHKKQPHQRHKPN